MKHSIASALAALCAGLAGLLAVELRIVDPGDLSQALGFAPEETRPVQAPTVTQAAPVPLPVFRVAPTEASAVIIERPLFFPSRRPAEPEPVAAAPEPPAEAPDVALVGTIITHSGRRAIVRSPAETSALVLSEGQDINGWTVASIEVDRLLLRHGNGEQIIALEDPASIAAARPSSAKPSQIAQRPSPKAAAPERATTKPAPRNEPPRGGSQSRASFYTPR
ncbi:hypothetical protein [Azospirillum sp.]|uniref:hypothetical protein n=1 Tax=Azospirillum sp. TaxID=34012 RepID=UPI002D4BF917|nr:hypothetical protein [Azospirillum sp.]HYD68354.1 hypothetical protein [Azospirillum sp.]